MEKPAAAKSKNKILKFLPKAAVSFQNPAFSPASRDKKPDVFNTNKLKSHFSRGFSGPIISMIPADASGRRSKNANFETQEPTSPKVSCMGKIKNRKKISKKKNVSLPKEFKPVSSSPIRMNTAVLPPQESKKKAPSRKNIFSSRKLAGNMSDTSNDHYKPDLSDVAPSLSQMKKFASSRDTFSKFDWKTAQIAPEDREVYSDEEDEIIIPFSAPILVGGDGNGSGVALEPRKEINLWKRRSMAHQPKTLQINNDG